MTTGLVDDYKLYNSVYSSQTVVSWSLEVQVWGMQVCMSGTEACSSLHASLGTGAARGTGFLGDIRAGRVETMESVGGRGFIWTLYLEGSFP